MPLDTSMGSVDLTGTGTLEWLRFLYFLFINIEVLLYKFTLLRLVSLWILFVFFSQCYGLISVPLNSYVDAPTPNLVVNLGA